MRFHNSAQPDVVLLGQRMMQILVTLVLQWSLLSIGAGLVIGPIMAEGARAIERQGT